MGYASLEDALTLGTEIERSYVCAAHDDHNASASVNAISGLFYCYSCGHAGKVDPNKIEMSNEGVRRFVGKLVNQMDRASFRYPEGWLNAFDAVSPGDYWKTRFNDETIAHYRMGTAPGVATYPMRDNIGQVMGLVLRDLTGEQGWKYRYPTGLKKSEYLLDYHCVTSDTVVLVEGMADAAAVYETGHHVALGCYGSDLSSAQARLLRRYDPKRILVAFDMDEAGEKGAARVKRLLGVDYKVEVLWWDTYKDIAEMPLSDRSEMLSELIGNG